MKPNYSTLDPALEIALKYGPDLSNGFTSHAPMATEAMCAMGRPDAVMRWIENYRRQMTARPRTVDKNRPGAMARRAGSAPTGSRIGWCFSSNELRGIHWRKWCGNGARCSLAGLAGAATHGIIRAGHAVRAMTNEETPIRRRLNWRTGWPTGRRPTRSCPSARHDARRDLPSRAIAAVPAASGRATQPPLHTRSSKRWFSSTIFRPLPEPSRWWTSAATCRLSSRI